MPLDSASHALWLTAWLTGEVTLDDAMASMYDEAAAHHVVGLPGEPEPVALVPAWGWLRRSGASAAALALPAAGDPVGLAGPAAFNAEALEAGEAVVVLGAGWGLVPRRVGAGVTWRALRASEPRPDAGAAEADRGLRRALAVAARTVTGPGGDTSDRDVLAALAELRDPPSGALPPGVAPARGALLTAARRALGIAAAGLATRTEGGWSASGGEDTAREALRELDRAARRAVVAACAPVGPERRGVPPTVRPPLGRTGMP